MLNDHYEDFCQYEILHYYNEKVSYDKQNRCFNSTEVTGKNNGLVYYFNEKHSHNNGLVSHNNDLPIINACMHAHYYTSCFLWL